MMPLPYPEGDFAGKTVIVTGANTGLGLEAARHFARLHAAKVILGCRDLEKGEAARADIELSLKGASRHGKIEIWQVNLESFASVKSFCARASTLERLDVVVENAGALSILHNVAEGYERLTTVNVISTWLMALMLLPVLRATRKTYYAATGDAESQSGGNLIPHLVIVSSNAHFYARFECRNEPSIFEALRGGADMMDRYGVTKLISVLVGREIADQMLQTREKAEQVVLNFVDPGACKTQLLREKSWPWYFQAITKAGFGLIGRTAEAGSRTYISAATAGWESHGVYLEDCKLSTPHEFVTSDEGLRIQKKLYGELMGILEMVEPGITNNI
ncbi:Short chain dehydrogenase atnD [Paramyrothecium foliicola]|nr:Short chain dehydrogenase atnD [Paramyrothecium foliicola]